MGTRRNFTVPGGFTSDTSTLFVDDPNNRVGIGNTSPTVTLDVTGALTASGTVTATGGLTIPTTAGTPSASSPNGALSVDTTNHLLYYRSNSVWNRVASIEVSDTAPTGTAGELWFNSATGSLFVFHDSFWIEISGVSSSGNVRMTQSDTAPTSPVAGDWWFNSSNGNTYIYYDSYWVAWGQGAQGPAGSNPAPEDDQLILAYQVFT